MSRLQYTVLNAGHLRSLEMLVNLKIKNGWQPQGGVHSAPKEKKSEPIWKINVFGGLESTDEVYITETNWCQAMIRKSED